MGSSTHRTAPTTGATADNPPTGATPGRRRRRTAVRNGLALLVGSVVLSSCTLGCENGRPVVLCWKSDYQTVTDPSGDLYYKSLTPLCNSLYGPDAGPIPDDAWPLHGVPLFGA